MGKKGKKKKKKKKTEKGSEDEGLYGVDLLTFAKKKRNEGVNVNITSYNLLASGLVKRDQYPYVSGPALKWKFRQRLFNAEFRVLAEITDVFCLQEIDHYDQFWKKLFTTLGFESEMLWKPNKLHGCCIAYRSEKFEKEAYEAIDMDVLAERKDGSTDGNLKRQIVAQIMALKATEGSERFVITNTHLYWDPAQPYVRVRQLHHLLTEATRFRSSLSKKEWPLVMCGDYNTQPNSTVYELLTAKRSHLPPITDDLLVIDNPKQRGPKKGGGAQNGKQGKKGGKDSSAGGGSESRVASTAAATSRRNRSSSSSSTDSSDDSSTSTDSRSRRSTKRRKKSSAKDRKRGKTSGKKTGKYSERSERSRKGKKGKKASGKNDVKKGKYQHYKGTDFKNTTQGGRTTAATSHTRTKRSRASTGTTSAGSTASYSTSENQTGVSMLMRAQNRVTRVKVKPGESRRREEDDALYARMRMQRMFVPGLPGQPGRYLMIPRNSIRPRPPHHAGLKLLVYPSDTTHFGTCSVDDSMYTVDDEEDSSWFSSDSDASGRSRGGRRGRRGTMLASKRKGGRRGFRDTGSSRYGRDERKERKRELERVFRDFEKLPRLRSAYDRYQSLVGNSRHGNDPAWRGEPPYTHFTGEFQGTLDYIFVEDEAPRNAICGATPIALARLPSRKELEEQTGLPSDTRPSDHLPITVSVNLS